MLFKKQTTILCLLGLSQALMIDDLRDIMHREKPTTIVVTGTFDRRHDSIPEPTGDVFNGVASSDQLKSITLETRNVSYSKESLDTADGGEIIDKDDNPVSLPAQIIDSEGNVLTLQHGADSLDDSKIKIGVYHEWTTIAWNKHWSDWHPASCAFDNSKSSEPTQQKFTTWVKHGTTGSAGLNLGQLQNTALNLRIDIMNEVDEVSEVDETIPAHGWGQEWHRWQVLQTRQRSQKCYRVVIGSGHKCVEEYSYFDTYTPIKGTVQKAWRTDANAIRKNACS